MRRTDARRRKRDGPEGVFHGFHVSVYKVDPRLDSLARNLLSKDDWRPALLDEPGKSWPKVSWVRKPSSSACRAERLAWATSCPDWSIVRPSCATKSEGPNSNSSEEVALCEIFKVARDDIFNTPFVDDAGRDMPGIYQVAQPLGGVGVKLVVVRRHSWHLGY
jgi:hypothetical protein